MVVVERLLWLPRYRVVLSLVPRTSNCSLELANPVAEHSKMIGGENNVNMNPSFMNHYKA